MKVVSLSGSWKIFSRDQQFNFEGQVPGSFFQALEANGYWGDHDVFYKENNRQCVELANRDIIFERSFDCDFDFKHESQRIFLEADGLDTLATIFINDQELARTENMHRRYRFEIGHVIKKGQNQIRIEFANSIKEITERDQKRSLWQVVSPVKGANHLRKMYCSFGWDWGPQIPDAGIFRDLRLCAYETARISQVRILQEHLDGQVKLIVKPELEMWSNEQLTIQVHLRSPDGENHVTAVMPGESAEFIVERPRLWWPNGLGDQPLYQVECQLKNDHATIHCDHKRIGLRTLTVRQEEDEWGKSFEFSVNGQSFFAFGANYIPQDVYLNRVSVESTRRLLQSCVDANFNCLRIWGGGVYPSDEFFDLCDEMGLVLWQDLMFACAIYDIHNPDFYQSISLEVRDNLERIRHHASLGLICGNNEMEWAFENWGFPHTKENRVEYIKQYEVLFPSIVEELCPEIFYWPASPSSGGHFDNPNDFTRGDVHDWNVWHGRKNYTEFRKHHYRFLSEFGFQSFPSLKTVQSYTEKADQNIFSPVMEDHQRNDSENGNAKIFHFISDYYRYPKDFKSILILSQFSQAEAVRYAVEHLRQNRGRCMGTTYWQLNDNWPTASWSSIDYFGRWKALQYMVKRCYAPILLSIKEEGHQAEIHLSNESWAKSSGLISWQLLKMNGELVLQGELNHETPHFSSKHAITLDFADQLAGWQKRDLYLAVEYREFDTGRRFDTVATFAPYKHLNLEDPMLKYSVDDAGEFWSIKIIGERFAKFVHLDLKDDDVIFSDNFFDLVPLVEKEVRFPKRNLSRSDVISQIEIGSLFDTYES